MNLCAQQQRAQHPCPVLLSQAPPPAPPPLLPPPPPNVAIPQGSVPTAHSPGCPGFLKARTLTTSVLTSLQQPYTSLCLGASPHRHTTSTKLMSAAEKHLLFQLLTPGLYVYLLPLTRLQTSESPLIPPPPAPPHQNSPPRQPLTQHGPLSTNPALRHCHAAPPCPLDPLLLCSNPIKYPLLPNG